MGPLAKIVIINDNTRDYKAARPPRPAAPWLTCWCGLAVWWAASRGREAAVGGEWPAGGRDGPPCCLSAWPGAASQCCPGPGPATQGQDLLLPTTVGGRPWLATPWVMARLSLGCCQPLKKMYLFPSLLLPLVFVFFPWIAFSSYECFAASPCLQRLLNTRCPVSKVAVKKGLRGQSPLLPLRFLT